MSLGCFKCKYEEDGKCQRHAPIVIANPNFCMTTDQRVTLTEYPFARGCGDFEPQEPKG